IGGGATGGGCSLDSQLRGMRTVLVEAGDFASGTSSASTKLIHGGVRYLEQAVKGLDVHQYRLVRHALRERLNMLRNGPFLSRPIEFLVPCFSWFSVLYFAIGLKLYDWLAGSARLSSSKFVPKSNAVERMRTLEPSHIVGSVSYTDGQFDDARYAIALIESMAEAGGEALNYARVVGFEKNSGGKLTGVEVEDQLSQARFTIRARAFVNATGPWSDSIRQLATVGAQTRMRLSKGVHILLPLEVLQSRDALLIPKTEDGRVLFALPWFDRLLVGTTEKELVDHEELYVTRDEVDYLLRHLNRYLTAPVGREQVVSAFVGVRPLLSAGKSGDTQSLSRDYEVEVDQLSGLISVMGGKWTTYRAMAEDTINVVQEFLGEPVTSSETGEYLLSGARGWNPEYWRTPIREYGVTQSAAQHLVQKFGTHAGRVLALTRVDPSLGLLLLDGFPTLRAEVLYAARYEMATTIEDVLLRRSGLQLSSWTGAIAAAPLTASILAGELNWNPEFTRTSIERYVKKINHLISTAGLADSTTYA
ncbi:MAG: FAD-dependent oxidoreductase, partial [Candidatus Acidiferrales bacterium]